ncbi:Protein CBG27656 [Caenorhabditis briggsae]|uniref:Protein CBG27656 n=1 Tax=Caenorhabditis briggsae TaxID=6238 RepID=B6IJA1_CAEBR|nr:Protein CBG27656 [Caenorhabditis briggsae]CAR99935.1 Protein CBG27656 [Caenorhabditis briggsae]
MHIGHAGIVFQVKARGPFRISPTTTIFPRQATPPPSRPRWPAPPT